MLDSSSCGINFYDKELLMIKILDKMIMIKSYYQHIFCSNIMVIKCQQKKKIFLFDLIIKNGRNM